MKKSKNQEQSVVFLKGKKTTLRPLMEKDFHLLMKWVNDPEVRQFISRNIPALEANEREWLDNLKKNQSTEVVLMIEVNGKPIGTIGLHGINWVSRTATTGAMIGEKAFWGKGYGSDAKMALLNYAFNVLNLRKISSRVFAFNLRSVNYSLRCGYKIEARLRRQIFANGKYWDEVILGLFKGDWLKKWHEYSRK